MQNLIVLCQRCLTWIEPISEMCPECGTEVILDQPDLDREKLAEILGKPLMILGPVRVERQGLPNYGFLIGTTVGVLFLPRLHRRVNGAWEGVSSQKLPGWWPFRGDLRSPGFLKWLKRPFGPSTNYDSQPIKTPDEDFGSLADRLMETPGAFFVEQRFIRKMSARRSMIKVERPPLRTITFFDETDDRTVLLWLNSLQAQAVLTGGTTGSELD